MENIQALDEKLKNITYAILEDGKQGEWPKVHQGLRELCYMVKLKGLGLGDFELLRKEIIQALEIFHPFAKEYIQHEEKRVLH